MQIHFYCNENTEEDLLRLIKKLPQYKIQSKIQLLEQIYYNTLEKILYIRIVFWMTKILNKFDICKKKKESNRKMIVKRSYNVLEILDCIKKILHLNRIKSNLKSQMILMMKKQKMKSMTKMIQMNKMMNFKRIKMKRNILIMMKVKSKTIYRNKKNRSQIILKKMKILF